MEANPDKIRAILKMEATWTMKEVWQLIGRIVALNWFVSKVTNKCLSFLKILRKSSKFEWTPECEQAFIRLKKYLSQSPLLSKLQLREDLYLYQVVLDSAIDALLIGK